jgi:broad specificity phosphatase PhoE
MSLHGDEMTKIILARHGHVEGIKPARFRGRTELPLTELGQAQAKAVAARAAKTWIPAKVYTSSMGRCVATGQEFARACRVAGEPMEALNDLDYGNWRWRTFGEVRAIWPELFAAWHTTPHLVRFPEGDSLQDLVARTANALLLLLVRHASETETVVLSGTTASIECSCSFSINSSQRIGGSPRSHARQSDPRVLSFDSRLELIVQKGMGFPKIAEEADDSLPCNRNELEFCRLSAGKYGFPSSFAQIRDRQAWS